MGGWSVRGSWVVGGWETEKFIWIPVTSLGVESLFNPEVRITTFSFVALQVGSRWACHYMSNIKAPPSRKRREKDVGTRALLQSGA